VEKDQTFREPVRPADHPPDGVPARAAYLGLRRHAEAAAEFKHHPNVEAEAPGRVTRSPSLSGRAMAMGGDRTSARAHDTF
jgi:hypothetical protein